MILKLVRCLNVEYGGVVNSEGQKMMMNGGVDSQKYKSKEVFVLPSA